MSGPRDDERLSAYLDGELDDVATAELEAQLAADPSLAARLDAVCGVVAALRGLDQVDAPAGFADRLRERLEEERRPAQVIPLPRWRSWAAISASVAAAVLVTALAGTAMIQGLAADSRAEQAVRVPWTQPVSLSDEAAVRDHFAAHATLTEAREEAAPGACLDAVAPVGGPSTVTHVESVVFQGRMAMAYVLRQDATAHYQALVVDPATCETRLAVPLE
ncbi:MAG: anti-sigma factor family protein [Egibacteraceae bacterium]